MNWRQCSLGTVAKFLSGGTPRKDNDRFWGGDIPWVSAKDLKGTRIHDSELHVTEEGAENGSKIVPPNTVLFVVRGMSLANEFRISISRVHTTFNQDLKALQCRKGFDPEFVFYSLLAKREEIRRSAGEASHGTKKLPTDALERITLNVPGLQTQRRIAEILVTYDDLIENNRRRIQLLEQSARLLYKEWFVHLRFPGHEHVKVVDGVPKGWQKVAVSEVIAINPSEKLEKGREAWYVPMSSLSEVGMTVDRSQFERRETHTSIKFRNGDVLLARITPCLENGKTAYVYFLDDDEVACGSTEFIVLRGRKVSQYFVYCLSRTHDFRGNAIKSMIGSSGRQRVQASCFDGFFFGLPPAVLQDQFDEIAADSFNQIRVLESQNERLRKARHLLLPRLMSGEIEV